MAWLEIKVQAKSQLAQAISALLEEAGALAVTTEDAGDQPVYELPNDASPSWDYINITGLFEEKAKLDKLLCCLHEIFPTAIATITKLPDQQWERAWMEDFKPMQFGKRLWIIPSYQPQSSPYQVILDPGLAFGTGKHPTTALCLQWLDENVQGGELLIDYGCGSGVLAIAALKLGAKQVIAIDHDPQALEATAQNGEKNNCSSDQLIIMSPESLIHQTADILISNILANPLTSLASKFKDLVASKGKIVLSGILKEQAAAVIAAYQASFEIKQVAQLEEWVRIDGVKLS